MKKEDFIFHLDRASFSAKNFAENYVVNTLHKNFRYDVILCAPNDGSNLEGYEEYRAGKSKRKYDLTNKEAADLIYRKEGVPIWIDISVVKTDENKTTINLLCSSEISMNEEQLYYHESGSAPFGVKSPNLPFNFKEGKKFKI
jgi:hypothetical protein